MTLHQLRAAMGAAWLVACGSPPPATEPASVPAPRDPIPRTHGPGCAPVAARMAVVIGEHAPSQSDGDIHQRALFELRCDTDRWSDDARSCLATISSEAEADGCLELLDRAQQRALAADRARLAGDRTDALE